MDGQNGQKGQKRRHSPEDIARRMELQKSVFLKDAEIYHIQAEKLDLLQQLVALEAEMYGRVSKNTALIMEVENCEIMNGMVRFKTEWEIRHEPEKMEAASVHDKLDQYKADAKVQQTDRCQKEGAKRKMPERM